MVFLCSKELLVRVVVNSIYFRKYTEIPNLFYAVNKDIGNYLTL
jgi:hypothetical protein